MLLPYILWVGRPRTVFTILVYPGTSFFMHLSGVFAIVRMNTIIHLCSNKYYSPPEVLFDPAATDHSTTSAVEDTPLISSSRGPSCRPWNGKLRQLLGST